MEFHEPVGLGSGWSWAPPVLIWACELCHERFDSAEDLRRHRFEAHPQALPTLLFRGRQLGKATQVITKATVANDFVVAQCDAASINGETVAVDQVPGALGSFTNDIARLTLRNREVSADFELEFALPSEEDLLGVEEQFGLFSAGHLLNLSTLDAFVEGCRSFPSAARYWDGVSQYLYGVLIKERSPQMSLPFEDYVKKFNQAAQALADYDRLLARAVRSLISFHFNHFSEASDQLPGSALAVVSGRFANWLKPDSGTPPTKRAGSSSGATRPPPLEDALTDSVTKSILAVASTGNNKATRGNIDEINRLLGSNPPVLDQVKLIILLAENQLSAKQFVAAGRTARPLLSDSGTARWAERVLARAQEKG